MPLALAIWTAWFSWLNFDVLNVYPPACLGAYESRLLVRSLAPPFLL